MAQRRRVGLPTSVPQLLVDQQARVTLVEVQLLAGRLGRGDERLPLRRRTLDRRHSLGLERELFHEPSLFLGQRGAFLGRPTCGLSRGDGLGEALRLTLGLRQQRSVTLDLFAQVG